MILDVYEGCFGKIYVVSPSVNLDHTWLPVKEYIKDKMKIKDDDKEDPIYFDEYDSEALMKIMETQMKITDYMKKQKKTKMFQVLIIIDDFADDPRFVRSSKLLHSLYTRGRHSYISVITATQVFNALHPIIRKNATDYIYKLRNYRDLESLVEELSALAPKKTLLEMYNTATAEPYSFWYINLMEKDINKTLYIRFEKRITLQ